MHQSSLDVLRIYALTELGRLDEAEALAGQVTQRSVVAPLTEIWLALHRGRCAWAAGRAGDARRHFGEAVAMSEAAGHRKVLRLAYSSVAAASAALGDEAGAARAYAKVGAHARMDFLAGEDRLGEAWLLALRGRVSAACQVLRRAAGEARAADQVGSLTVLLTDLARFGSPREAAAELRALAGQVEGGLGPARAEFADALAAGDAQRLLSCSGVLDGLGAHGLAAEAAAHAAMVLRRDHRRAAAGAERVSQQAATRVQGANPVLRSREPAASFEPLTAREQEIAVLAARRLSSNEIADELRLSRRTVDNTLQKVYRKLGVRSRLALGQALVG